MPSPKRRAKGRRDSVTTEEEVELVLGPEPGHRSLFVDAAERAQARATLARVQEQRDAIDYYIAQGPILREQSRRHFQHIETAPRDPVYPALLRIDLCPICTPEGVPE
jgi:hypothetical protein